MIRVLALLVPALALAACQSPPEEDDAVAPEPASVRETATPEPALPTVDTLEGAWRIAGIDGQAFDESYGLALSADEREIWWEPRCAGYVRGYAIEGRSIEIGPRATAPPEATDMAPPVCLIGLPPRLGEVFRALELAESVERTPENGVRISGGSHSVTLFRQ